MNYFLMSVSLVLVMLSPSEELWKAGIGSVCLAICAAGSEIGNAIREWRR